MGEFHDMLKGWHWRERRKRMHFAELASWVTAPHLKKPLDPNKLIEGPKEKKKTTQKESQSLVNELMAEMGVE